MSNHLQWLAADLAPVAAALRRDRPHSGDRLWRRLGFPSHECPLPVVAHLRCECASAGL